jgi:hypothetical protein
MAVTIPATGFIAQTSRTNAENEQMITTDFMGAP